jgi:hypothetical protein
MLWHAYAERKPMDWFWWFGEIARHTLVAIGIKTVADLIALIFGPVVAIFLYKLWRWLRSGRIAEMRVRRAVNAVAKEDGPYGKIEGKGIWLTWRAILREIGGSVSC